MRHAPLLAAATLAVAVAASAQGPTQEADDDACRREVVELHRFLERWSNAELPADDEAFARFDRAIAPGFTIVSPSGEMSEREAIVAAVRRAHGRWLPEGGRIEVRNYRFHAASGDLVVCSYEEWHHLPRGRNGRLSSAVLTADPAAPGGLAWLHLSEVWLEAPSPAGSP